MSKNDKVALITGASKGIGLGIARSLLDDDYAVVITGRNAKTLAEAKAALNMDAKVLDIVSDVRSMQDCHDAIKQTIDRYGRLDVLIANAGVGHFAPIDELTEDQWNQTIDINLTGVFNSVQSAIPALKKSEGYIFTIASLAGTNFFPRGAAYNASKFGLVGFTQAVMLDLRNYGIKVSTLMPGSVSTYFNNHIPSEADAWKIQPEDLGQLVSDLLKIHPRTLPSKVEIRPSKPPKK